MVKTVEQVLDDAEGLLKATVAAALMCVAIFAVGEAAATPFTTSGSAAKVEAAILDTLLFAVIVAEIACTLRQQEGNLDLKWFLERFLVIGIVSAVREILLSACLSLQHGRVVQSTLVDIGVMLTVVLALAVAFRLVGRNTTTDR